MALSQQELHTATNQYLGTGMVLCCALILIAPWLWVNSDQPSSSTYFAVLGYTCLILATISSAILFWRYRDMYVVYIITTFSVILVGASFILANFSAVSLLYSLKCCYVSLSKIDFFLDHLDNDCGHGSCVNHFISNLCIALSAWIACISAIYLISWQVTINSLSKRTHQHQQQELATERWDVQVSTHETELPTAPSDHLISQQYY